eukprot:3310873-Pyramimonas_sp.AAC.1
MGPVEGLRTPLEGLDHAGKCFLEIKYVAFEGPKRGHSNHLQVIRMHRRTHAVDACNARAMRLPIWQLQTPRPQIAAK